MDYKPKTERKYSNFRIIIDIDRWEDESNERWSKGDQEKYRKDNMGFLESIVSDIERHVDNAEGAWATYDINDCCIHCGEIDIMGVDGPHCCDDAIEDYDKWVNEQTASPKADGQQ